MVIETVDKRLHSKGRQRIIERGIEARKNLADGNVKRGSVSDLMADNDDYDLVLHQT